MPVVHGLAHARDLLDLLRLEKVAREVRDGGEAANAVGVARGGDRDGARRASPEEEDGDGINEDVRCVIILGDFRVMSA